MHIKHALALLLCQATASGPFPAATQRQTLSNAYATLTYLALPGYRPEAVSGGQSLYPNEVASDFAFIPFGGGARKCVGDQFALMEATVSMAMLVRRFTFELAVPPEKVRGP